MRGLVFQFLLTLFITPLVLAGFSKPIRRISEDIKKCEKREDKIKLIKIKSQIITFYVFDIMGAVVIIWCMYKFGGS